MDTAQTGRIEFSEFIVASSNVEVKVSEMQLEAAFKRLDVSKTGYISTEDLKELLMENDKKLPDYLVQ